MLEEMEHHRAHVAELKLKQGQRENSADMDTGGDAEPAEAAKPTVDIGKLHNEVERFKKDYGEDRSITLCRSCRTQEGKGSTGQCPNPINTPY